MSDLPEAFLASLDEMEQEQGVNSVLQSLPTVVNDKANPRSIKEILDLIALIEKHQAEAGTFKWFEEPYTIDTLPKHKAFFAASNDYNEICFLAANRVGKEVRISEPVLTPSGWKVIGDLAIGDEVSVHNGTTARVTGVFDQGIKDIYRVWFNDGSYVDCGLDHQWKCKGPEERFRKSSLSYGKWKTATLRDIIEHVGMEPKAARRYSIPVVSALSFEDKDLPIDPYTLGVFLGDGSIKTNVTLHTEDPEILNYIEWKTHKKVKDGTDRCPAYSFKDKRGVLRELGLFGKGSYDKFVPEIYKHHPRRLEVLQGLMDTDGYTNGHHSEFVSVSEQLARDVVDLCRSLGIRCTLKEKKTSWTYKGEYKKSTAWRVSIWTTEVPLFKLNRKAAKQRYGTPKNGTENVIVKIEHVGKDYARCIEVDSADHTYIISNYVVTHNTICGTYALACHLTGLYPDWWPGRKFDKPINAWAIGQDARATRDTLQKELIGGIGQWGTGMIPANCLGKFLALHGTPSAIDTVMVKHVSGGWSQLGFKNCQQDIKSFMGTARDVILGDEEIPLDIYNECNIRTATTNGLILLTFTPLEGLTPLVVNFCKRADYLVGAKPIVAVDQDIEGIGEDGEQTVGHATSKAVIQAGWDDVPWLDEATKIRLLDDTPLHLRDARSKGLPAMGSGNVYSVPVEQILEEPFAIPESWPRMYGLDVGWNRTAAVWGALDPATDIVHIYDQHYRGQEEPFVHAFNIKARGDWIHGVIDPAARGRGQADGKRLWNDYKDLGLILFEAKNEVESGILNVQQRLQTGRLRIFKTCVDVQKEYMLYRRDKHGRVIKENDHALDALRYIINNLERMISKAEISNMAGVNYHATKYNI